MNFIYLFKIYDLIQSFIWFNLRYYFHIDEYLNLNAPLMIMKLKANHHPDR
jgi:hypothetical protein